jgi:CO/xanthine dehydrogenase FAD-binding subunit
VKAPPFAYARAESVEHALRLLAEAGEDAKLLAGGQSLVPLLAHRVLRPTHLVDIDRLDELTGCSREDRGLVLGALTRHAELERMELDGRERLLSLAAAHVGHVPIRSRGTLGGSVAHADPAAELPLALLALDAEIVARSASGSRAIPVSEFFLGPFTSALGPEEAVTEVVIPASAQEGEAAFAEVAIRHGDFALASAAASAVVETGRLRDVRVALGAVEAAPVRATAAETLLEGAEPTDELIAEAAGAAASSCKPVEDRSTSAAYRQALVYRLVRDVLTSVREGS